MQYMNRAEAQVLDFPQPCLQKSVRKTKHNVNKDGSIRKINNKVYVDFMYLDQRVRESSGLPWNRKNAKHVRHQLDKIMIGIQAGTFRFADVFKDSKRVPYFKNKERLMFGGSNTTPGEVNVGDYMWEWYELLEASGRVTGRTLLAYKGYMKSYLSKFFCDLTFADLNKKVFDRFVSWARKQRYRRKVICNKTVNKLFIPLRMVCKDAAIEYDWGSLYHPFFGFKKLPEDDVYHKIIPFSFEEQKKIVKCLPEHWRPYFLAAFCIGFRQGEQIAIFPSDVDWVNKTLTISRALTRDSNGKLMLGTTKSKYSRRTIRLIPAMFHALELQKSIYDKFKGRYFFCSTTGGRVSRSYLRKRVWMPSLEKAGIEYRAVKQTRHSFATNALSCGENPLWIARVMGHRDTDMMIRVYSKYIENARGIKDGSNFNTKYDGFSL